MEIKHSNKKILVEKIKGFINLAFPWQDFDGKVKYFCVFYGLRDHDSGDLFRTHQKFFTFKEGWVEDAASFISNLKGHNEIYFGTALFSEKKRNVVYADKLSFLFADVDTSENQEIKHRPTPQELKSFFGSGLFPEPSIVVRTSDKENYHYYWLLDSMIDAQKNCMLVSDLQSKLNAELSKFTGRTIKLDATWPLSQVLRAPGTFNNKQKKQSEITIVSANGTRYLKKFFEDFCKDVVLSDLKVESYTGRCEKSSKDIQDSSDAKFKNFCYYDKTTRMLFNGKWEKLSRYKSQSEADFRLCCVLDEKFRDFYIAKSLFVRSRLYRKIKGIDYINNTIKKAMKKNSMKITNTINSKGKDASFKANYFPSGLKKKSEIVVYKAIVEIEKERGFAPGSRLYVSYAEIAINAGLSKRSVGKALRGLEKKGLIELKIGVSSRISRMATEIRRLFPDDLEEI